MGSGSVGRKRPLGDAEKAVLVALLDLGGSWTKKSRWTWESRYWTIRLLDSLVCKELVQVVVPDEHYTLTPKGLKVARNAVLPFVPTPRTTR